MSPRDTADAGEDDQETMCVQLIRAPGKKFGIAYRVNEQACPQERFIVTAIALQGAYEAPSTSQAICAGDALLSVNAKTDPIEMLHELRESNTVDLVVFKSGPRWHLKDDITGEMRASTAGSLEEDDLGDDDDSAAKPLTWQQVICIYVACIVPPLLVVVIFSDVFIGLSVYGFFAPHAWVIYGDLVVVLAALLACMLYIVDWVEWTRQKLKTATLVGVVELLFFGFVMKVRKYPIAPLVIGAFHVPVMLGSLKYSLGARVLRRNFYLVATSGLFSASFLIIVIWLGWIFIGGNEWGEETRNRLIRDSKMIYDATEIDSLERGLNYAEDCDPAASGHLHFPALSSEVKDEILKGCTQVASIYVIAYNCPLVMSLCNFVMGLFCLGNVRWLDMHDSQKLAKTLKQFVLLLTVLAMGGYCAASLSGASMELSTPIMSFLGAAFICLSVWFYIEIGNQAVSIVVRGSPLMQQLMVFASSDWARALFIMATMGVVIPGFLLINAGNQAFRKWRGTATTDGFFTKAASEVFDKLRDWNWVSILSKLNILVEAYFTFQVGVSKVTYVFLSYLNEQLATLSLTVVIITFFGIGFAMFLFPPVPGIPVYVCSGIIISTRAEAKGMPFILAILVAEAVSFADKLAASSAQYLIGLYMGASVSIQKLVGVDKVPMRSVEKILLQKGLSLSKCAILVGGPDWPTSVLCGILKLNLFQVLWGTTPVVFTQLPCVVAGAFLAKGPQGCSSLENSEGDSTIASSALIGSLALQVASMVLASYYITSEMEQHGAELAKSREEHKPIEELTKKQAVKNECYKRATEWNALDIVRRTILASSAVLMLGCFFVFLFFDSVLFESFDISGKIRCPISDYGLDNNVFNLVKPLGIVALIAFAIGVTLHLAFLRLASNDAGILLKQHIEATTPERPALPYTRTRSMSLTLSGPQAQTQSAQT
eukprot:CAMPEP_0170578720 /NCGR_PEP_ID=MMETSP0224-20130122/5607_1 /TAXON_ID=285029 /ORGANISM="Togula jolla, Strain CCCM 725" /LENGTH=940 /DNA_ID=CAMNT_0010901709 /DNA_START=1 /DNA_END=2823 /DNA_ORIENTATION=-